MYLQIDVTTIILVSLILLLGGILIGVAWSTTNFTFSPVAYFRKVNKKLTKQNYELSKELKGLKEGK